MYSVLIGDDNENLASALASMVNSSPLYRVVAAVNDGESVIERVEKLRPDIIILDIIMPKYDGVYVVNHIRNQMKSYNPVIYILSGIGTDPVIRMLNDLHVDFFSLKPVKLDVVIQNLDKAMSKRNGGSLSDFSPEQRDQKGMIEYYVNDFLLRLGLPPHRISTKCLSRSLLFYICNSNEMRVLTKIIYPYVAKSCDVTESSVEKNIRNAILKIQKCKTDLYLQVFAYSADKKITNGEFLSVASDYISREIGVSPSTLMDDG